MREILGGGDTVRNVALLGLFLLLVFVIFKQGKEKEHYFWVKIVILFLSFILTFSIESVKIPLGILIGYSIVTRASTHNISIKKITLLFALAIYITVNYVSPPLELLFQTEEDKIVEYLSASMEYHDISTSFNERVVNIEYPLVNIREDFVQHQSLIIIHRLKEYPHEDLNLFNQINFRYYDDKDTDKTIAEVRVEGETLMNTEWDNLQSFMDIPEYVDFYQYREEGE
jgi:hypothetical protein